MFTQLLSGLHDRWEGFIGEHACQIRKGNLMWGYLTVIASVLVYLYSFDRAQRLKGMQELVRLLRLFLEFFSKR